MFANQELLLLDPKAAAPGVPVVFRPLSGPSFRFPESPCRVVCRLARTRVRGSKVGSAKWPVVVKMMICRNPPAFPWYFLPTGKSHPHPGKAVTPTCLYLPGARHGKETGLPGGYAPAAHGTAAGARHGLLPDQGGVLASRGGKAGGPQRFRSENHHLQLFRDGPPRGPLQLPPAAPRQSRPLWIFCPRPSEPAPRRTQFWKGSSDAFLLGSNVCGKAHRPAYLDSARLPSKLPLPGWTARPLLGPSLPPAEKEHHAGQWHAPVPDVSQPRGAGAVSKWLQHLPRQRRLHVWPKRGVELDEGETLPRRGWDRHGHGPLHPQWLHASVLHRGRDFRFNMDPSQQAHLEGVVGWVLLVM